ncbi:DUF4190 domain-containing protein [Streptomyces sp. NPDC090025]|uniref:DUF4190 domain-containing protein n=1 Tax=Streptomyces sp. NPDC090025 TaxID=3365922 RepID=UPI0038345AED
MTMPTETPGQQPWGPPPGMPGAPQPPYAKPENGLGVTALVLGIVGIVTGATPFLFWLGGILGLLALIFGIVGVSKAGKGRATNKGMAITGTILGGLAMLAAIVWTVLIVTAVKEYTEALPETADDTSGRPSAPATPGTEASTTPTEAPATALKFGETHTYPDGIKVTVSKPKAYQPDSFAAGHKKGNKAFKVAVTIVNGTDKPLDAVTALPDATDAQGRSADMVFDGSHASDPFSNKILPGKSATADFTFSLSPAGAGELQIDLSPTILEHESQTWTGPTQ